MGRGLAVLYEKKRFRGQLKKAHRLLKHEKICGLSHIVGSCPILVIVEREVLYTAYGHHVGEVKHVRHATGSHACSTLTRTAWPSRRPRRRGGTPGVRPKPPHWRHAWLRGLDLGRGA